MKDDNFSEPYVHVRKSLEKETLSFFTICKSEMCFISYYIDSTFHLIQNFSCPNYSSLFLKLIVGAEFISPFYQILWYKIQTVET